MKHKPVMESPGNQAQTPSSNEPLAPLDQTVRAEPPVKRAYRKPVLKRLGLLVSVTGSDWRW